MTQLACMVLAAGKGTRMRSERPKVLHEIAGRPMISRLLEALSADRQLHLLVIVGHGADEVKLAVRRDLPAVRIDWVFQKHQLGTGHAVKTGIGALPALVDQVVVVNGDLPMLTTDTVRRMAIAQRKSGAPIVIGTMTLDNPAGYGRILRTSSGRIMGIREERDCAHSEREIKEINAGIYCFSRVFLEANIDSIGSRNAQNEFYLTDMVEFAATAAGASVDDVEVPCDEMMGVNDRSELAAIEERVVKAVIDTHMRKGVTIHMPSTVWIEEKVLIGAETVLWPGVSIRGATSIGMNVTIRTGSVLVNSNIEDGVVIEPYSMIEDSAVRREAVIGPFARLRPGTDVGPRAHVGNFVELKKTRMGEGSKANHLSYLGDGVIGRNVNIGAGTIFCNYDGFRKHQTIVEDGTFIGSDSQLVAPVRIGRNSYVGSGSTITADVPPESLALARARQVNHEGRATRLRAMLESAQMSSMARSESKETGSAGLTLDMKPGLQDREPPGTPERAGKRKAATRIDEAGAKPASATHRASTQDGVGRKSSARVTGRVQPTQEAGTDAVAVGTEVQADGKSSAKAAGKKRRSRPRRRRGSKKTDS